MTALPHRPPFARRAAMLLAGSIATAAAAGPETACGARSGATPPQVVELFTSEGCSSCPPADRWLSTLKGRHDVLALGFHVTYWDYLGWSDRFGSREGTDRQRQLARHDGARSVYTPQVRADGRDWHGWPRLPAIEAPAAGASPPLQLRREGDTVVATVGAAAATASVTGYWVVLEDGHESRVRAGENAGETLHHDHVVRLYRPVPAWTAAQGQTLRLTVSPGVPRYPRRVAFVVVDATTERPLQALALGC